MRFIISFFLIAAFSFIACLYLPWWSIALVAFLVCFLLPLRAGIAFLSGFLALFLLWGGLAYWIDTANEGVLSSRIALVLPLQGSGLLLILVTGLLGGVVGGMSAMSGSLAHPLIIRKPAGN